MARIVGATFHERVDHYGAFLPKAVLFTIQLHNLLGFVQGAPSWLPS
jgi:hypothetical protein